MERATPNDALPDDVAAAPMAAGGHETLSPLGWWLLLSCIAIWGVNAVAFKIGTRGTHGFDAILMNGLRFLAVAPCLALLVGLRRPSALRLTRQDVLRYALFGFFAVALGETLVALALGFTSVANVTLLSHGTISLFTALWAVGLRQQTITRTGWVGAIIALAGVAMVATQGGQGLRLDGESWIGDLIAVGRSMVHGGYLLVLARWLRERSVLQVTVYNCVFGALWLLPYVVWKAPSIEWSAVPPMTWAALAWTVVPTTLYGFLAWNWGMRRVGAVAATNLFYLMPVSAALAAWVILGERLRLGQVLGGVVIIVGIVLLRWDTLVAVGWQAPRVRLPWRR